MQRARPRLGLFAATLAFLILLRTFSPAGASPVYFPGVFPGDWVHYGQVAGSWISGDAIPHLIANFMSTQYARTYVQTVQDTSVTAVQTWRFTDSRGIQNETITGDVRTGTGNLTFWIISAGISVGDNISEDITAPTLNETITKQYLGYDRTVNVLNVTTTFEDPRGGVGFFEAEFLWDKLTGVLLEVFLSQGFLSPYYSVSGSAHAVITETSIFGGPVQPDISISADPESVTVVAGSSTYSTVTVRSLGGFEGLVALSAQFVGGESPLGVSVTVGPQPAIIVRYKTNSSTLAVFTSTSTPEGDYVVNVTATDTANSLLTHYSIVSVHVTPYQPPFRYSRGVRDGHWAEYGMFQTYWSSTFPSFPKPSLVADYENVVSISLNVTYFAGTSLTVAQTWKFNNGTTDRTFTLSGDVDSGDGDIFPWIIAGGLTTGDHLINDMSAPTINATIARSYAGGAPRLVNVFNSTASVAGASSALTYFWDKETGALVEQFYSITDPGNGVQGRSNFKVIETNLWKPPDFQISPNLSGWGATSEGSESRVAMAVESLYGFSGIVKLSLAASDPRVARMSQTSVSLDSGQSVAFFVTIITWTYIDGYLPGVYTISVTATSGALSHTVTGQLTVVRSPDFRLTVVSGVSVESGSSTTLVATVTSLCSEEQYFPYYFPCPTELVGFSGLTITAPAGIKVNIDYSVLHSTGAATLTIEVASNVQPGTYYIVVGGTWGSRSHSETIAVTVTPAPPAPPRVFGLQPELFYGSVGGIASVLVALAVLALRRRRPATHPADTDPPLPVAQETQKRYRSDLSLNPLGFTPRHRSRRTGRYEYSP